MQKITAIMRVYKLDEVKTALINAGILGMTITGDIKSLGRDQDQIYRYRGLDLRVEFLPKLKLEVVVDDIQAESAIKQIISAASTGEIGDGKILVSPVERVVRIRTSETDFEAL